MNETESMLPQTLPVRGKLAVRAWCKRFWQEWKDGKQPRIKDYLCKEDEGIRADLLRGLLEEELELRVDEGERPKEEEYAAHFQGAEREVVAQVFAAMRKGTLPHVPGYELLEELGRGGMGVVYRARQISLKRTVALKMILHGDYANAASLTRFRTEAESLGRLQHPHIVQVYNVGEDRPYISMEFCSGGSLDRKLQDTPLPPREAARLVETLARAVQAAHDKNVIHRDLKPANVLLTEDGALKISDFGLAKKLDEQGQTPTALVLGTPSYMAPEQAQGAKEAGPAADIYGLGAILYECLTGRPPFKAATPLDTIKQVIEKPPAPPRMLNLSIDADLETICLKCLEKEPTARFSSAEELAEELCRYRQGEPIKTAPQTLVRSLMRSFEKRREVLPPGPWSRTCLFGAVLNFCTSAAVFWITRLDHPALLFLLCIGLHALLSFLIIWRWLVRRRHEFTPEEGILATLHSTFCMTVLCLCLLAYPWDRDSILALYPVLALFSAFRDFVIARLYWGPLYFHGLAFSLLALLMKLTPEWAPLEYAVVSSSLSLASGLVLFSYAKKTTP